MRAIALTVLAVSLAVALWPADATEPAGLEVQHWDSLSHPDGFEEVFQITQASGAVPSSETVLLVDDVAVTFQWDDADGVIGPGDRFRFVMEAYDFQRDIELLHGDTPLWTSSFGSGAGTPV